MRTFRHWTPRYLLDRSRDLLFRRMHPGLPWLTPEAIRFLDGWLQAGHTGLEFGSGRSTLWFARRVARLTSVEHNRDWYDRISRKMREAGIDNVDYILEPKDVTAGQASSSGYVRALDRIGPNSLDFVLVDGTYRDHCALGALEKLLPGGILVIDNVNRYLPSGSRSPNSRTPAQGPAGDMWRQVAGLVSGWQVLWTSTGVSDTAIYFKPSDEI